jgi:VIT1/CCC1 family predicted Fe2+/Mn2+ transporter
MKKDFDYRGSIILGMHDAIVSLTGLIAGLGLTFTDRDVIILSCIISSITASLSMGAANYLAVKSNNQKYALYAACYTAAAYMTTCVLLVLPFFVFLNRIVALLSVFIITVLIIYFFNRIFYTKYQFNRHFYEMLAICLGVSVIAFAIGQMAKYFLDL